MTLVDQHYRNQQRVLGWHNPFYLVPLIVRQTFFEIPKFVFEPSPGRVGDDDIEPA
jgi:hypothetical protein